MRAYSTWAGLPVCITQAWYETETAKAATGGALDELPELNKAA